MDVPASLSRRHFFQAAGSAFAASVLPPFAGAAFADPVPSCLNLGPPRNNRLTSPNFAQLAKLPRRDIVGLRPHRCGGVRLEREPPVTTANGVKHLIHNYGHSGAGITLAWGCASTVAEWVEDIARRLVADGKQPTVAIYGSGVIGLTVATEIAALKPKFRGLKVSVYAKDAGLSRTCSLVAGGQFEPSGLWREYAACGRLDCLHDLILRSARKIREIQRTGKASKYGIAERRNYTFDYRSASGERTGNEAFEVGVPKSVICRPAYGTLPFAKLSTVAGRRYDTWLINPQILLPQLVADAKAAGVQFPTRLREVRSRADFFATSENIVVNCTGLGAKEIVGLGANGNGRDVLVYPIRGKLVVFEGNPQKLDYFFSGGCGDYPAYLFARQSDVVVGGTWDVNPEQDPIQQWNDLLARVEGVFDGDIAPCRINNRPPPVYSCRCQPEASRFPRCAPQS